MIKFNTENIKNKKRFDPDQDCEELGRAHCDLWSKKRTLGTLFWNPGNKLETEIKGIRYVFKPDSITNSFRKSNRLIPGKGITPSVLINSFGDETKDLLDKYIEVDYSIGSSIIFPIQIGDKKIKRTMNQARGCNHLIQDRFDYTLECIKRYYEKNNENPLKKDIIESEDFFNLFADFKEYVSFFFLDDLIDENGNVKSFTDKIDFNSSPLPLEKEKYNRYIFNSTEFIKARNTRIDKFIDNQ